jgi:hypothetical protein
VRAPLPSTSVTPQTRLRLSARQRKVIRLTPVEICLCELVIRIWRVSPRKYDPRWYWIWNGARQFDPLAAARATPAPLGNPTSAPAVAAMPSNVRVLTRPR